MKYIEIVCDHCGQKCEKRKAEIVRQRKRGRTAFFCSLKCSGSKHCDHLKQHNNSDNLIPENRRDEFSNFRYYIKLCKQRNKSFDLDAKYLKCLWEDQAGSCPFTGWNLILRNHQSYKTEALRPEHASLDRIDNGRGYVKGNVRFVSVMFNLARNKFSDEEVIGFCEAVRRSL
jgi:hypothetical protein